jgi:plastocyanin
MKKLYTFVLALMLAAGAQATIHTVQVANNTFTPQTFSAQVGDTVRWVLQAGAHTTTSTTSTIPSGAATWDETMTTIGQTFDYKITVAGNYGYVCTFHTGMAGGFTAASSTGLTEQAPNVVFAAYPNPFKDKLTITHTGIDHINIFNMTGSKISSMEVSLYDTKTVLELSALPAGVYFVSTVKEGIIVETKRVVKTR